jgi:hypothetical protein
LTGRHIAVADHGSVTQDPPDAPAAAGPIRLRRRHTPETEMVSTGVAAAITRMNPRTIERWVDDGKIPGGRAVDPDTGQPISGSWRWVDVVAAVAIALSLNRAHLIPKEWQHLIPAGRELIAASTKKRPKVTPR